MMKNIPLVVCTSDARKTALKPYFSLLYKYWKERPDNIYLVSETVQYHHEGLNIINCNYDKENTWSERLLKTLEKIDTEYVILSLEDYFLLGDVKQNKLEKCLTYMQEDKKIASIRLLWQYYDKVETYKSLSDEGFFRVRRIDTQVALWRKKALSEFLNEKESAWDFEINATKRAETSDWVLLWHYRKEDPDFRDSIFPYDYRVGNGYGIYAGVWLWNNKPWFEENGIYDVNYKELGVLSERAMKRRIKYVYKPNRSPFEKFVGLFFKACFKIKKAYKVGIKGSLKYLKRK